MYDLLRQLETNPMQKFIKGVKFVTGGWYIKFSVKAKMSFLSYKCPEHLNKINGFNFKALHQQWWHPHTRKAKKFNNQLRKHLNQEYTKMMISYSLFKCNVFALLCLQIQKKANLTFIQQIGLRNSFLIFC